MEKTNYTIKKAGLVVMVLALATALFAFAGCSKEEPAQQQDAESVEVKVASLKGPTSLGIANLVGQSQEGQTQNTYNFTVSGTADEVLPNLIQGNIDIALLPANAASVVYNKTNGGVQVIDINTLGVLYVVSGDESLKSLNDLAGKTVYMTGKGTTPEFTMAYLLEQQGIKDQVTLEFKSEATEVAAVLAQDPSAIAVLPEPYVTSVCAKNEALAARMSLSDEWDAVQKEQGGSSKMVTGVTVVRSEFLQQHPQAVEEFLKLHAESVKQVNASPEEAGQYAVDAGIMENAQVAAKAIPHCNIVCITGAEMKADLSGYLQALFDQDASSVGGNLPGDDFYFVG